ncbi:MAG: hypothetical protein KQJ78_13340 [Deltaproteobacteria bacterium]|nr:hypothetical protein [Deltaproteobacteria bacterium]
MVLGLVLSLLLAAGLLGGPAGGPAWAAAPANPADPAYQAMFPPPQPRGTVTVKLHPDQRALGHLVHVGFGVPFPPGYVRDPNLIALLDSTGQEMPLAVTVLARWPAPIPGAGSIRAALVQYRDYMSSTVPRQYTIRWGEPRTLSEKAAWRATQDWLPVEDGSYPASKVHEPPVYAVFDPAWLDQALLKGRFQPLGQNPSFALYDQALVALEPQLNNRDHPQEKKPNPVPYLDQNEPWLYDRAMTFFVAYLKGGGLLALKDAQKAAQFYAANLAMNGGFYLDEKHNRPDVKYAYQECLALEYWLFGDPRMKDASSLVSQVFDTWTPEYTPGRGFWTERHLGLTLLAVTAAYELTGEPSDLAKARRVFEAGYNLQTHPPEGAPKNLGAMWHQGTQHGEGVEVWVASPWMSALFVDASLRYYLMTADPRVPQMVWGLADFLVKEGVYRDTWRKGDSAKVTFPYYLLNLPRPMILEISKFSDKEHALDTALILAAAIYFGRKGHKPTAAYEKLYAELMQTANLTFQGLRLSGKHAGVRLKPTRKYNWWFRSTPGLGWFVANP